MPIILSLIFVICVLMCVGAMVALPTYLPVIKTIAYQSPKNRKLIVSIMAIATFIICLVGISYLDAQVTETLSATVSGIENPFIEGSQQDKLLTRELWLQNIVIPSVREDCYTADVVVCAVSKQIENSLTMDANTEYIILLAHALTAMLGNIMMVNYILGDNRKKKVPTLIIG